MDSSKNVLKKMATILLGLAAMLGITACSHNKPAQNAPLTQSNEPRFLEKALKQDRNLEGFISDDAAQEYYGVGPSSFAISFDQEPSTVFIRVFCVPHVEFKVSLQDKWFESTCDDGIFASGGIPTEDFNQPFEVNVEVPDNTEIWVTLVPVIN